MHISIEFKRVLFSIPIITSLLIFVECRTPMNCIKKDANSPQMDTLAVIQKAKRHNAYWPDKWVSPPRIAFDEKQRTWTVHSVKTYHTDRGECKYTNGCTVVKSVTLVIDDQNKKVVSKTKERSLFPNYE